MLLLAREIHDKGIEFNESDDDHLSWLKRFWFALFPNDEWKGPCGEHWKLVGFQGKNPKTDFRAMGIMGLRVTKSDLK